MQIAELEHLEKYVKQQGHTWAKVYSTNEAELIAEFNSGYKTADQLLEDLLPFLKDYADNYCIHFKKSQTASADNICKIKCFIPKSKNVQVLQGAAPVINAAEIEAQINKGITERLEQYKKEQEIIEMRNELTRLKTASGKFEHALAGAFALFSENYGSKVIGKIMQGLQPQQANLNGTPDQQTMEGTTENINFDSLDEENQEKVINGINNILKYFTPDEIQLLGGRISEQPDLVPFVKNFLKF